jgi:hypothetical protein
MKTYLIKTIHEVFIDKFNEGELDFVNAYNLEAQVKAENPENAIAEYFKNQLYYDFNMNHAYVPHQEEETEEKNTLHYSVLVDNDNNQASGYDVESWKEDKLTLYSNNIFLSIYELNEVKI